MESSDVPDVFVYDYKYLADNPSLEDQRYGILRCSRRICASGPDSVCRPASPKMYRHCEIRNEPGSTHYFNLREREDV